MKTVTNHFSYLGFVYLDENIFKKVINFFTIYHPELLTFIKKEDNFDEKGNLNFSSLEFKQAAACFAFQALKEFKKQISIQIIASEAAFTSCIFSSNELKEELIMLQNKCSGKVKIEILQESEENLIISMKDIEYNHIYNFHYFKKNNHLFLEFCPSSSKFDKIFNITSNNLDMGFYLLQILIQESLESIKAESKLIAFILDAFMNSNNFDDEDEDEKDFKICKNQ